jgi:hypothetical protein
VRRSSERPPGIIPHQGAVSSCAHSTTRCSPRTERIRGAWSGLRLVAYARRTHETVCRHRSHVDRAVGSTRGHRRFETPVGQTRCPPMRRLRTDVHAQGRQPHKRTRLARGASPSPMTIVQAKSVPACVPVSTFHPIFLGALLAHRGVESLSRSVVKNSSYITGRRESQARRVHGGSSATPRRGPSGSARRVVPHPACMRGARPPALTAPRPAPDPVSASSRGR